MRTASAMAAGAVRIQQRAVGRAAPLGDRIITPSCRTNEPPISPTPAPPRLRIHAGSGIATAVAACYRELSLMARPLASRGGPT